MSNTLLTIDMITNEALNIWLNANNFLQHVDRQFDSSFGKVGAKIGEQLRLRKPLDYIPGTGSTVVPQASTEQDVTLTLATQRNVAVQFTSAEKVLSLDEYSDRILKPAVNGLVGAVALDLMSVVEQACNFVSNKSGGFVVNPTVSTWLEAGAKLSEYSLPTADRKVIISPRTQANTVATVAGLFNPQPVIGDQYRTGVLGMNTLGFDWYMDQTVIVHTTGAYNGNIFVNGTANQTGSTLAVAALPGPLNAGDIIYIPGNLVTGNTAVNMVNRITKGDTGEPMQFVLTAGAALGATSLAIYPPITPPSGGNNVIYQTVTQSPAANQQIMVVTKSGEAYRKNFAFGPQAVAMVFADLFLPQGATLSNSRKRFDNVSLRMIEDYITLSDEQITRLDVLYGYSMIKPEWCVVVADSLT